MLRGKTQKIRADTCTHHTWTQRLASKQELAGFAQRAWEHMLHRKMNHKGMLDATINKRLQRRSFERLDDPHQRCIALYLVSTQGAARGRQDTSLSIWRYGDTDSQCVVNVVQKN